MFEFMITLIWNIQRTVHHKFVVVEGDQYHGGKSCYIKGMNESIVGFEIRPISIENQIRLGGLFDFEVLAEVRRVEIFHGNQSANYSYEVLLNAGRGKMMPFPVDPEMDELHAAYKAAVGDFDEQSRLFWKIQDIRAQREAKLDN